MVKDQVFREWEIIQGTFFWKKYNEKLNERVNLYVSKLKHDSIDKHVDAMARIDEIESYVLGLPTKILRDLEGEKEDTE